MSRNLVTKAEFARVANVSRKTATVQSQTHLKRAVVGNKIDLDHPLVVDYIEQRKAKTERDSVTEIVTQSASRSATLHRDVVTKEAVEVAFSVMNDALLNYTGTACSVSAANIARLIDRIDLIPAIETELRRQATDMIEEFKNAAILALNLRIEA